MSAIDFMLLILEDVKSYLKSLILSFWLVQNLSLLTEGFPTSGNDTSIGTEFTMNNKGLITNSTLFLSFPVKGHQFFYCYGKDTEERKRNDQTW